MNASLPLLPTLPAIALKFTWPDCPRTLAVTRALTELQAALQTLPLCADRLALLSALDHVAARLSGTVMAFCEEPAAVLPAQRALLLLAGRAGRGSQDMSDVQAALHDLGDRGFSKLLETTLAAGDVPVIDPIDPFTLAVNVQPLGHALAQIGRGLLAVDDLAHALSLSSDAAAALIFVRGLFDVATMFGGLDATVNTQALHLEFLKNRGCKAQLAKLLLLQDAIDGVTQTHVEGAREHRIAPGLALFVLALRLAEKQALLSDDKPEFEALLQAAELAPLEVFDAACLWQDLDSH